MLRVPRIARSSWQVGRVEEGGMKKGREKGREGRKKKGEEREESGMG